MAHLSYWVIYGACANDAFPPNLMYRTSQVYLIGYVQLLCGSAGLGAPRFDQIGLSIWLCSGMCLLHRCMNDLGGNVCIEYAIKLHLLFTGYLAFENGTFNLLVICGACGNDAFPPDVMYGQSGVCPGATMILAFVKTLL